MSVTESTPQSPAPPASGASTRHPPAIWFFFWGEFAERSSYYGMRAILFLYMTQVMRLEDTSAGPLYSTFKMACYFLPLVGGYLADRWLGKYWTIVGFSVPYVLGHFILGIPNYVAMVIALGLLAGGSGVIKPNISTLLGQTYDQLRPGQERLRTAAFMWFYFSINVGALISMFFLPEIRNWSLLNNLDPEMRVTVEAALLEGKDVSTLVPAEALQHAYAVAFAFPAWLMVLSLAIFAAGKPFYAVEKIEKQQLTAEERRLQWQTVGRLFGIFALISLFWFGYEHNDSLWIAFIRDHVDLRVPFRDTPIAPDQLQFLNALVVILSIPTFNFLFARLDPQVKVFKPMRRVLAGFVLTAASIGIMSVAGFIVQGQAGSESPLKVSVYWPAIAYVTLTFGEVLVYGTMLELAYTAAPKSMKSFITACFLLTNTIGNFLNVLWMPLYGTTLSPPTFYALTASIVLAAGVAFLFIGKRFERGQAEAAAAGVT